VEATQIHKVKGTQIHKLMGTQFFTFSKLQNMSISRNNKLSKDDTSFGPWVIQILWSKTEKEQKTQAFWGFTF
jgi:hypothetical protein